MATTTKKKSATGTKKTQKDISHEENNNEVKKMSTPTQDEIRQRTLEIYISRGYEDRRDFDDWLQAEKELKEWKVLVNPK